MDVEKKSNIERSYVGIYSHRCYHFQFCIDGRFVVSNNNKTALITDLFHSKSSSIPIQFDCPPKRGRYNIENTVFLSLNTVLVFFYDWDGSKEDRYLGIGKNEMQSITVESATPVDKCIGSWTLIGRTSDSNLRDGVYASYFNFEDKHRYVVNIKMSHKNVLCLSQPMKLPYRIKEFGLFGGHIYGFLYKNTSHVLDLSKIVKVSIESGAQEFLPTKNSTTFFDVPNFSEYDEMVCFGCIVYVLTYSHLENKSRLVILDLKSLEWKMTDMEFDGWISWFTSDEVHTLIVAVKTKYHWDPTLLYRIIVEQPDSLWNLASMAIKRQSDSNPRYREYILSKLPTNPKFRCPLPRND